MDLKLAENEKFLEKCISNASKTVHFKLGPGLLDKVYEIAMQYELEKMNLTVRREVEVPIAYGDIQFLEGFKINLLIEKVVICIVKAEDNHNKIWESQLLNYLRLMNLHLGFLINFNVDDWEEGFMKLRRDAMHGVSAMPD